MHQKTSLDFMNMVIHEKINLGMELNFSEQNEIREGINELNKGKRISYYSFLKKIS